jgi:hypothetical protein
LSVFLCVSVLLHFGFSKTANEIVHPPVRCPSMYSYFLGLCLYGRLQHPSFTFRTQQHPCQLKASATWSIDEVCSRSDLFAFTRPFTTRLQGILGFMSWHMDNAPHGCAHARGTALGYPPEPKTLQQSALHLTLCSFLHGTGRIYRITASDKQASASSLNLTQSHNVTPLSNPKSSPSNTLLWPSSSVLYYGIFGLGPRDGGSGFLKSRDGRWSEL